jgi:hypothetical protein
LISIAGGAAGCENVRVADRPTLVARLGATVPTADAGPFAAGGVIPAPANAGILTAGGVASAPTDAGKIVVSDVALTPADASTVGAGGVVTA